MRSQVIWVRYNELSDAQQRSVQARYRKPYTGYLYRTYNGQLTMTNNDRRRA
jgi:hypothetical protein